MSHSNSFSKRPIRPPRLTERELLLEKYFTILSGYAQGAFLMQDDGMLTWFESKDPTLIPLNEDFHIPKSLRPVLNQHRFRTTIDLAFEEVMEECSMREYTWIGADIFDIFCDLHRAGVAHSIEVWDNKGVLQGGLYGLAIGQAFIGESMFFKASNASKVALVALVNQLREDGFVLLDAQMPTEHIMAFGASLVIRAKYEERLRLAVRQPAYFNGVPTVTFSF